MRKRLVNVVAWLVVGVIAAVAITWWCALYADLPIQRGSWVRREGIPWPEPVEASWPLAPDAVSKGRGPAYAIQSARSMVSRPRPPDGRLFPRLAYQLDVHDIGWPLPALRWERHHTPGYTEHRFALKPTSWLESTAANAGRRLPTKPLLPGAVVDPLALALAAWMLANAPTALQRFVRASRGRCGSCGYDLRGSSGEGCPECGAGRTVG